MPAKRISLVVFAVLLATTGCGASGTKTVTSASTSAAPGTASPGAWTGLGATLTDWESAHPKDSGPSGSGCSGEGCYGSRVTVNAEPTYEFTTLSTTGPPEHRVDGYEQAIGGTPTPNRATRKSQATHPVAT